MERSLSPRYIRDGWQSDDLTQPDGLLGDAAPEVAAVMRDYARAWSDHDLQRVADLWDAQAEHVSYVAEELNDVLSTPEEVTEHLLRSEVRLRRSEITLTDLQIRELGDELVLVTFVCRWNFEWVSHSRVSAILRRRSNQWRFIHYMESPYHVEESVDASRG